MTTDAATPGVGYNSRHESLSHKKRGHKNVRTKENMTEEEIEMYREAGRKGARVSQENMLKRAKLREKEL